MKRVVLQLWYCLRIGNWKFFRFTFYKAFWGLTHMYCRKCKQIKGINTSTRCEPCKYESIMEAIFGDEERPWDHYIDERGRYK